MKKTYKLTYESAKVQHAVFPKDGAKNHWCIGAHVLKSFSEYFGPKAEQLDIYYKTGRTTFTSYTEKIVNGSGQTSTQFRRRDALTADRYPQAATANFHNN